MAALVKQMDEYAIAVVKGDVVRVYTAQSQSPRTMDKATFQASKEGVLGVVADMIGVSVEQLAENAGRAA